MTRQVMVYSHAMDTTNTRPIPDLLAERKVLAQRLAEINRKLEALDGELFARLETALTAFGMWSDMPRISEPAKVDQLLIPPLPRHVVHYSRTTAPPRQGEVGALIHDKVAELLHEHQRPLKTNEIYSFLLKKGVEIPGKDPRNNLSAHLSRSRSLVRFGNGWWFAEKKEPPEGGS
jgi:hypothetical protein